jgi:hypothetical protein
MDWLDGDHGLFNEGQATGLSPVADHESKAYQWIGLIETIGSLNGV